MDSKDPNEPIEGEQDEFKVTRIMKGPVLGIFANIYIYDRG